jgi:hypothetical protein
MYQIDSSNIIKQASGANELCVDWSDRTRDFWILVQGPQIDSDQNWLQIYTFELIWNRRWSFIGPLMGGIFLIIGLIIPGILVFVMFRFLRRPATFDSDDGTFEHGTYSPSYAQQPMYGSAPTQAGYAQPNYTNGVAYGQQPMYGQQQQQQYGYQAR